MAIGTDRYASRGDTLLFIACVGLSIAALSLPDQWRDPVAQGLRQSVLAPFLFLQRQTELLAAARYRYDGVVAQRDCAVCWASAPGWAAGTSPPKSCINPSRPTRSASSCRRANGKACGDSRRWSVPRGWWAWWRRWTSTPASC